jgi:hypothetical protein
MTIGVGQDFSRQNADDLERALESLRRDLPSVGDKDRARRESALAAFEGYTALLREPAPSRNLIRYCFKLVFPDGRWSVDEKQLAMPPQEGDVLGFPGFGDWRIESSQEVGARPVGKEPREFFVCAPAA